MRLSFWEQSLCFKKQFLLLLSQKVKEKLKHLMKVQLKMGRKWRRRLFLRQMHKNNQKKK